MPSSQGEFTLQFEMRTLRQQSTSIASRLVSIFRLSMVRLSTPVARMAKCPPCRIEMSRRVTLRQFFRLMDLLPTPAARARSVSTAETLAPDQPVMPVAMAKILKLVPGVGLRWIIAAAGAQGGRVRCHDSRARVEV